MPSVGVTSVSQPLGLSSVSAVRTERSPADENAQAVAGGSDLYLQSDSEEQKENPGCSQLGCRCVFSAATHDSEENGSSSAPEEPACDPAASPDICESSSGSDPTGSDRSGEERGPAPCAGEPVTAAGGDASERSAGSAVVTSKQVACLFIHERKSSGVLLSKATRGHAAPTNQTFFYIFRLLHKYKAKK